MVTAKLIRVKGKVQGVSFRYYTMLEARRLGVLGTVQNLDDGSVLVTAEGEMDRIASLVNWCREGPLLARVDEVEEVEIPVSGYKNFVIVR
jgi:acylphosphatase